MRAYVEREGTWTWGFDFIDVQVWVPSVLGSLFIGEFRT